jgi:hypothetical protein
MTSNSINSYITLIMKQIYSRQIKFKTLVAKILKTYFSGCEKYNFSHQSNPLRHKGQDSTNVLNPKIRTKNKK